MKIQPIKAIQLLKSISRSEIADFVLCMFEWRTTGICIKGYQGSNLDVDYGDWIISFPDGSFIALTSEQWDEYMMLMGKLALNRIYTYPTN